MSINCQKEYTMATGQVAYIIQGNQVFYTREYVEWLELRCEKDESELKEIKETL